MSQIGQEVPILELQAAVYNYDGNLKNWAAKDGGSSRVWIFHNTTTNAYRIIGQSLVDKQYNINSPIKTDLVHKKLRENFIQWRFRQTIFGLSFQSAEDADKFEGMLTKVIDTLGGPTTPQPAGAAGGPSPGGVTQQAASASVHPSGIQTLHRVRSATVEPQQSSGVPTGSPAAHLASSSGRSAPLLGRTGSAPAFALPPVGAAGGPPTPSPLAHSMPSGGSGILPSPATAPSVASGDPRPPEQRRTQSMYTATPNAVYSTSNPAHLATIRTPGTPAQARQPGADVELSNALYAKDNKELSKRDYRAKEIYTSEESYLVGLDVIIEEYLRPSKAKGVFNEKEIRSIFSNIEQIRDLSRELLVAIKAQMTNWTPESTVGEIFLKKMPFMKIYIPYCRDHKGANELLEDKKNNKRMSTYLKESQSNSKLQLDLNALLITPVQRVLRYPLLLKALLEVTEETHPDYPHLVSALEQMQKIADEINQSVEVSESTKAVHELSKTIPGLPRMISTTRQLVKHGPVQVTSVKKSPYTYLLLFSDVAVFASPSQKNSKKLDMKEKIHLEKVWVDGMKDTSSAEVTWQINSPDATFLIQSAGKEDKTLWVDKCQQRIIATCHKNGVIEDPTKPDVRKFLYKYKEGPKESYEGYWVDAKYEGQGKLVLQDQTVYEGAWEKGKAHGAGKIIYSTGESYDGQWHRDKPHGQGTLITILATYTGGWDNGRKHGTGTLQWANGDVFEGEFVNDLREGNGTLRTADGSEYSGQWKADQYNGRGKLTTKFVGSYDGDWVSGRKHGHGVFTYTNGDQYNGDWVDDLRDGKGTFTQADGKVRYEGDWKEDSWEGNGILIKPDFRYEGEFKGGRMYGNGTLTTPEGTYSGGWAEDRREGKGKWTGANGETYDGEFHSDLRFGKGTWIDVDGSRYDGKWVKGRKEGSGVFTYPNGAKYSGSWQRDRRHGQGVWTTPDETSKYVGDWVNDLREGKGTFTDATGSYNGEWLRDMRNGQGVLTYGNGISYTGTWKDDRRHGTGLLRIAKQGQPDTVTNMNYENGILIEPPCTNAPPDLVLPRLVIQK